MMMQAVTLSCSFAAAAAATGGDALLSIFWTSEHVFAAVIVDNHFVWITSEGTETNKPTSP